MGVYQNQGYLFRGLHNKDYSILGPILGSPYFGKLPNDAFSSCPTKQAEAQEVYDTLGGT